VGICLLKLTRRHSFQYDSPVGKEIRSGTVVAGKLTWM